MRIFTGTLLVAAVAASSALAKPALRDVAEIDDKMLQVGLALEISDECPTIDARKVRGLNFLWSVKKRANALGYSDDEINAYRKSEAEKARLRAKGATYVKSKGLDPKNADDLCKLGRDEIAKGSTIGSLLRAK